MFLELSKEQQSRFLKRSLSLFWEGKGKGIPSRKAQLNSFAWPLTLKPFLCSPLMFESLPSECDSTSSPGSMFKGAGKMPEEKAKWQEKAR